MSALLIKTENIILNFLVKITEDGNVDFFISQLEKLDPSRVNAFENGHLDSFIYQCRKLDPNYQSVVLKTEVNDKSMNEHVKAIRDELKKYQDKKSKTD
jgi:hypothetical protein